MHINSISCGQGAPSLFLIVAAGELHLFEASIVIVADTGWENDCLWSTGQRTDARTFFEEVTKPLAEEYGMQAAFVRTLDKHGNEYPPIHEAQFLRNERGKVAIDIPLFGSRGGRLQQSCTSKWKKQAIRQELRRRGSTTATTNLGITLDEVHRVRPNTDVQWETLAWPLVMGQRKFHRTSCITELDRRSIPYLVTTECDGCPHKDLPRWQRTSPATLAEVAEWEAQFDGEFFLHRSMVPITEAIEGMENGESMTLDSCDSGYCFT